MNFDNFKTNMENLYATYYKNLYFYKNEDHSKLEEMNTKSLNTPADKKKFFVVRNSEGIVIVTTSLGSSISLSFKEYKEYLQGKELQHKSYAIPVFDEILRINGFECEIGKFWHTSGYDLHENSVNNWSEKRKKMETGHSCFLYHNTPHKNIYAVGTIAINGNNFSVLDIKIFKNKITDSEIRFFWNDFNPQLTQQFKNRMLLNYIIKQNSDVFYTNHAGKQDSFEKIVATNKNQPLNQILYGSPGTGKTYNTINRALCILGYGDIKDQECILNNKKIISKLKEIREVKKYNINFDSNNERSCVKALFDYYHKEGQIEFVTFHQNYGYEEFVEGIKPIEDSEELSYETRSGIFKKICELAEKNAFDSSKTQKELQEELDTESKIYDFFTSLLEDKTELANTKGGTFRVVDIKKERVILHSKTTKYNLSFRIRDFKKIINSSTTFKSSKDMAEKIFNEKTYQGQIRTYMYNLYKTFVDANISTKNEKHIDSVQLKPYILIIDEINRGNVSKIFGELITLIEPSKRVGADEELRVTLPYSGSQSENNETKELFGVPSNLYIIGTMNTADRSITSLDTALRRRFEFVEMMPDAKKLENIRIASVTDKGIKYYEYEIKIDQMLQAINDRIEFLYDREKTIGHAFFLSEMQYDKDENCYFIEFNRLKDIFQNKIIPLLQEYFYNDYEAINAVLNNNGMIEVKVDSNKQEKSEYIFKGAFKKFINDRGLDEKKIFKITPKDSFNNNGENLWDDPQTYINIYKG